MATRSQVWQISPFVERSLHVFVSRLVVNEYMSEFPGLDGTAVVASQLDCVYAGKGFVNYYG